MLIALDAGCTAMVLETGLGGRLDATNVVEHPALVVFTAIGMDHMQFLGNTIAAIAREKAGIIKRGAPVVSYDNDAAANAVIRETACALAAPCRFADADAAEVVARDLDGQTILYRGVRYRYPLIGTHQLKNFVLILTAVEALREAGWQIPEDAVHTALSRVRWPGRFEIVCKKPVIVLDGAHNPQAAQALAETVRAWFPGKRAHFSCTSSATRTLPASCARSRLSAPVSPSPRSTASAPPIRQRLAPSLRSFARGRHPA